jgi:translation initiation factor 1A
MAKQREEEEIAKLRLPKEGEVLGVVELRLGGDKVRVRCADGNLRICRIPGRLRRRMWVREGNLVLVRPWLAESECKGDVEFVYTPTQASWLRKKGYEVIEL